MLSPLFGAENLSRTRDSIFEDSLNNLFITALKSDRRRLKAEKFDLLTQMKQLYSTLEDKEKELRDFIRNYEQVNVSYLCK